VATDPHNDGNDDKGIEYRSRVAAPAPAPVPSGTEMLASTIAGAVERQLTQYVSAMSKQVEAARQAAESTRAELRAEFLLQLETVLARVDSHQQATESYQRALQTALEERLAEFANHQHVRLTELDGKLAQVSAQIQADVGTTLTQTTHELRDRLEQQTGSIDNRIDELFTTTAGFDARAAALTQHVDDATQALAQRMDDGDQVTTAVIEARISELDSKFAQVSSQMQADVGFELTVATRELREHMEQQTGSIDNRIDELHATTTRFDTQVIALVQHVNETTQALAQRMDEGDQLTVSVIEDRLGELDGKLTQVSTQIQAEIPVQVSLATQGLRDYLEHQTGSMETRINDLHKNVARFDEQAGALAQHVNETTQALAQRMDDGDQLTVLTIEGRLAEVRTSIEQVGVETHRQLAEHAGVLNQRIDTTEMKTVDRMLAMEERMNEQSGTKIAGLEATIGRIGAGFDDAMGALSQRLSELESRLHEANDRVDEMAAKVAKVDEEALDTVREQLSTAIGEAMLVRIEVDRVVASTDEKLGKYSLRMAEIEAQLADEMDVSTAVQLERLDELERAVAALDPNQFVRKVDPTVGSAGGSGPSDSFNQEHSMESSSTTSEPSFSSH